MHSRAPLSNAPRMCVLALALLCACGSEPGETRSSVERPHPVVVASGDVASEVEVVEDVAETIDIAGDIAAEVEDASEVEDESEGEDESEREDASEHEETNEVDTEVTPTFPFVRTGDTRTSQRDTWDRYACAPDSDESGPEDVFAFEVAHMGILRATLDDVAGDAVDLDVHLLSGSGPESCVRRDNVALAWVVRPGTWTLAVDTWVGSDGVPRAGPYRLEVTFVPLDVGRCAVDDVAQRMFWSACGPGPNALDCSDDGTTRTLRVPSIGPVVGEAHLVTVDETFPGDGWPTALRDQIDRHYQLSQAATGYTMARAEPWAPEGEGGSHWGGGATGQKLPVLDEAWYVNMYWRERPARGRRMLVVEPWSGRAVVAAGGWETGPGSNTAIGGAVEEIHNHLGTSHREDLVMGFLTDDTLPLGPISCWP